MPPWFKFWPERVLATEFFFLSSEAKLVLFLALTNMGRSDGQPIPVQHFKNMLRWSTGKTRKAVDEIVQRRLGALTLTDELDIPLYREMQRGTTDPKAAERQRRRRETLGMTRQAVFSALQERDGGECAWCGSIDGLTIDHVVPFSAGGGDDFDNLRLLCRPCNTSKGDREYPHESRRDIYRESRPVTPLATHGVVTKQEEEREHLRPPVTSFPSDSGGGAASDPALEFAWVERLREQSDKLLDRDLASLMPWERFLLAQRHALDLANCSKSQRVNASRARSIASGIANLTDKFNRASTDVSVRDYLRAAERLWERGGKVPLYRVMDVYAELVEVRA